VVGLFPLAWLQERWAGARGELGCPAFMWSASHGSPSRHPFPHKWQVVAVARTLAAFFL
jgi:hypothetical protein